MNLIKKFLLGKKEEIENIEDIKDLFVQIKKKF